MQLLSRWLGRWPVALACVAVLAAATLLPGLGTFGLWEPQELRQHANPDADSDADSHANTLRADRRVWHDHPVADLGDRL